MPGHTQSHRTVNSARVSGVQGHIFLSTTPSRGATQHLVKSRMGEWGAPNVRSPPVASFLPGCRQCLFVRIFLATCGSVAEGKLWQVKAWLVRANFEGAGRAARSGPTAGRKNRTHCSPGDESRLHLMPASQDCKRTPGGVEEPPPTSLCPQALWYKVLLALDPVLPGPL